jgi:hypothetical protein
VSNDPSIANRMPLVLDPAPSGRVNPQVVSTASDVYLRMLRENDVILVLQGSKAS